MALGNVGEMKIGLAFDGSKLKTSMGEMEGKAKGLGSKFASAGAKIGKVLAAGFAAASAAAIAFGKASINAYNEQEKALAKLEQTAANQNWSKNATKNLMAYNAELQKTGIIGDEVFAAGQAQLGTFALTEESVKKLTPALGDLLAATSGYGTTTDNATQMANLMGKAMQGNVGALQRYGVTLTDAQKEIIKTGTEQQKAAAVAEALAANYGNFNKKLAETPQGQVKQLSNNFGDLKEMIGGLLAGDEDFSFDKLTKQLELVANNVMKVIETFAEPAVNAITTIVDAVATQLGPILERLLPVLVQGATNIVMSLVNSAPKILDALLKATIMIVKQLAAQIPVIIPQIVNAFMQIVNLLTKPENLQLMLQAGLELLMALIKAIPDIIIALAEAIPTIIDNIVEFISNPENIMMILRAGVQILMALVTAIPMVLPKLLKAVGSMISAVPRQIIGFAGAIGNAFGQIIQKGVNKVKSFVGKMTSAAGNLISGLIKGIGNGAKAVINKVKDICKGALDGIKSFFGIKSPSRVMAQMGKFMMQGLGNGIEDNADKVVSAANDASKEILNAMDMSATVGALTTDFATSSSIESSILASVMADDYGRVAGSETQNITVNMNNNINNKLDAQEIGNLMMTSIRRAV